MTVSNRSSIIIYNRGFIGDPQGFDVSFGEYGPPIMRNGEIDWRLFSVTLTIADTILTLALVHLLRTWPKRLRIKNTSSTFRASLGIIYGCWRCTLTMYLFRSEPFAFYTIFSLLSLLIYIYYSIIALLFKRGIAKHLRYGKHDIYVWETPLNPFFVISQRLKQSFRHFEYRLINRIQDLSYFSFEKKRNLRKKELSFFGIKFKISDFLRNFEHNETRIILEGPANVKIETSVQKWNEAMLFSSRERLDIHFLDNFKEDRVIRKDEVKYSSSLNIRKYYFDKEQDKIVEEVSKNYLKKQGVKRRSRSNSESEKYSRRFRAIKEIQNEYSFGSHWLSGLADTFIDNNDEPSRHTNGHKTCLVKICVNGLIYEFDTTQEKPNVRKVLSLETRRKSRRTVIKKSKNIHYSFIEIVGIKQECLSNLKTFYYYSDFRRFGLKLNALQKQTVLWLLNTLNGSNESKLTCFKKRDSLK